MLIAYKRVSTTEQSTDRQLADCGIEFDKVFEDKASGKDTSGRPALVDMLSYVREGDTVYVHSMDRLARNLEDLLSIVKKINSRGATLIFKSEGMTFDGANDEKGMGKFILSIMGAVAEFERNLIRQRQREGIEAAKAKGNVYKGRKPIDLDKFAKIDELKEQGLSIAEACRRVGVAYITYYKHTKRNAENKQ